MSPTSKHVVVIGAGPGGYVCAIRLAQRGQRVTVIERDALGGTCLNWGCIPSKALIHAVGAWEDIRQNGARMGILGGEGLRLDLPAMQTWKRGVLTKLTQGIGHLFKQHGIVLQTGTARLLPPQPDGFRVALTRPDGQQETLSADAVVLAAGSKPMVVGGWAPDGQKCLDSRHLLDVTEIPPRLAVLGGGVIGLELGQLFARMGSKVTIIELATQVLPGTDADIVRVLTCTLKRQGIDIHTGTRLVSIEDTPASLTLRLHAPPKEDWTLPVDKLLLATGRQPDVSGLNMEAVGLQPDAKGYLPVDAQQQTAVPGIYAVGDLCRPPLLAHKASKEGLVAAEAIAGLPSAWDVRAMPSAIFTVPEIASVGLSQSEAEAAGVPVRLGEFPWAASGRALSTNATTGFVKLVAHAETDVLLGAHVIGAHASELLGELTLAIEMGATAEDIALTVHAHPTLSEGWMEAAEAVHQLAVHIYQKP
jgi:dihydrolipoamide dehydrogenase